MSAFTSSLHLPLITKTGTVFNATNCDSGTRRVTVVAVWVLSFNYPSVVALALDAFDESSSLAITAFSSFFGSS